MQITPKEIDEFRRIWREEFQEDITPDEAMMQIRRLDALYALLAKPAPDEKK